MLQEKNDDKNGSSRSNHEITEQLSMQFFKDLELIFSQPLFTNKLKVEQPEYLLPMEWLKIYQAEYLLPREWYNFLCDTNDFHISSAKNTITETRASILCHNYSSKNCIVIAQEGGLSEKIIKEKRELQKGYELFKELSANYRNEIICKFSVIRKPIVMHASGWTDL